MRGYGLVKKETNNKQYYYHQNEHGDITHLTNTDSEVENYYRYDVFGNIREQQENVENVFKYAGEQLDSETQQYYLRARFYNPVIARFMQEDVYRGDGLNLYVYVVNNPLLWIDPSGYAKNEKIPKTSKNSKDPKTINQLKQPIFDENGQPLFQYLYRADDNLRKNENIGYIKDSPEAKRADIQDVYTHVNGKNKKLSTSRFNSFTTDLNTRNPVLDFTDNGIIVRISAENIKKLTDNGDIVVYDIYSVEAMRQEASNLKTNPKKKNLVNAIHNMEKNDEVLIEGQIPAEYLEFESKSKVMKLKEARNRRKRSSKC